MHNIPTLAALATTCIALCACNGAGPKVQVTVPGLAAALGGGWVEVPLPDSRLMPGAIIEVTPVGSDQVDLRWLGSLQGSCGVPEDGVLITSGEVPQLEAGSMFSLSGDIGATLKSWGVTAQASYDAKATLTIDSDSVSSLDLVRFRAWHALPANAQILSQKCGSTLALKNAYVVQEAFVVSSGKYSFSNDKGIEIGLSAAAQSPVKANVGASGENGGKLQITKPIVFALRRVQRTADGAWLTLGSRGNIGEESPLFAKTIRRVVSK